MKQAGLKNDSAWFRMNKWLKKYREAEGAGGTTNLHNKILSTPGLAAYAAAMQDIVDQTGVLMTAITPEALATSWSLTGIPRQVWMGKLTFDVYENDGETIKPKHWREAMVFGYEIRTSLTQLRRGTSEILDVINSGGADQGNPGGIADANIDT